MKRRHFVKTALAGGSVIMISPLHSCELKSVKEGPEKKGTGPFDLEEVTVGQLQQSMQEGRLTAENMVQKYLERISTIDVKGPGLRSVLELNADAPGDARSLDHERNNGKIRGPLHGIPVLIKGNIDTAGKMQTTAGSLALAGFHAPQDAFIVRKLREAGAVILGKANLSEWANIRSTRSSSGWSGQGGQTRNPYDITRSPCGSSSGSAVAVAANLCVLAVGTETDGSIVCPSSMNGVVGIKPTLGLWSRYGIIPIAHSQDTAGPMARTVRDAAILLAALKGRDDRDPDTANIPSGYPDDFLKFLDPNAMKGARIGIIRDFMGFHAEVDKLMEQSYAVMKTLGAELVEVECAGSRKAWGDAEWLVLQYELKADMNKYLKDRPSAPVKSLLEIIDFNNKHKDTEMPWFDQETFLSAEKKGGLNEPEYLKALKLSKSLTREIIRKTMDGKKLSALVAPTNAPAWKIDLIDGDHDMGGTSDLAAISGYPSITVPAGFVHGLPIGISFTGNAWTESTLISLAYSFEQATKARIKPEFAEMTAEA